MSRWKMLSLATATAMIAFAFSSEDAQALEKVKMSIAATQANYITYYAAIEKGYFKEEGFEVEIVHAGGAVICAAISPYRSTRNEARKMVGENFITVYMDTPIEVCEQRDVKGLYAKARQAMAAGKQPGFTGVDDPYEPPIDPEITLKGFGATPEENAHIIIKYLEEQGYLNGN